MIAVDEARDERRRVARGALLGVVLCGGESRRMGRDKAGLELEGRSLLARAVDVLRPLTPQVVLASGRPPRYPGLGLEELADLRAGGGPLAGLEAALVRADPDGWVLALACDMPHAVPEVFGHLLEAAERAGEDGCMLATAAGPEPLYAVYHARCLGAVRSALDAGERRMVSFHADPGRSRVAARIGRLREEALPGDLARRAPARNVNTPEDWRRALETTS